MPIALRTDFDASMVRAAALRRCGHDLEAASNVLIQAVGHRFTSDLLDRHESDELDLIVQGKLGRTTMTVRFADYRADIFATDTRKLWLQADWAI